MSSRILSRVVGLGLLVAVLLATPAAAAPVIDGEFTVSSLESNNKITQGPDGNIWLTLSDVANDVAKITPSGQVEEFDLEATNARGITSGPDNFLWITRNGGVTKFSPNDPVGTKDPTEIIEIVGNHSIVSGPDGNLWVATDTNLVKIPPGDPSDEQVIEVSGLSPRDIDVAGPQLAIADFTGKVVIATTAGTTTDFLLSGGSQGVAGGPDNQVAFSQQGNAPHEIGLLTPPGPPQLTTVPETDPFGVAFGSDGAYWFAQFATDSLVRLTTDSQTSTLGKFSAAGGPRQITSGPENTLWVTLEDGENNPDKVARVSGVDPPAVPIAGTGAPETQITKGPKKKVKTKRKRAKVRFRFKSSSAGAQFECALTKLKKRKKGKPVPKPRFRPCRSPQTYRVPVGRYRFQVRAVLNGVADPTPAKRVFRVIRKR